MANGADRFTVHMEACSSHVDLLERSRHPESPGGREITDEEWDRAIEHGRGEVQRGSVELVLMRAVQHNIEVRGLSYVLEAGLDIEKNLWYSVRRFFGLVGPRGGKRKTPASLELVEGLHEG